MHFPWERTKHRTVWSQDDQAKLAELVAAGATNREVAIEMGRSQESVRQRAVATGLIPARKRKPHSREKRKQFPR